MTCIICNSKNIRLFYTKKNIPIYQNFLFNSYKESIECKTGNIDLVYCEDCSFVYNKSFDQELIKYSNNYENTQFYSDYFQKYIQRIINFIIKNFNNLKGALEIGCGNGDFLKLLSNKISDINLYGFDDVLENNYSSGNLNLYNSYYSKNIDLKFNLVILRHVLEHINNPINFLKENISLLNNIFIEVPSFEWIVENNAYWDIFYEHCNYFTEKSLFYILNKIGFKNIQIIREFNNQYFWIYNKKTSNIIEEKYKLDLDSFIHNNNKFIEKHSDLIIKNRCYIWGAGAKGISFCNYLDPNNKLIEGIIDINPRKQNKYCPKTGHKIISPDNINKKIDYIIIMNPNYETEILENIKNIDSLLLKKIITI